MRILLIVDDFMRSDSLGGGDVTAQIIRAGLQAMGYSVAVACNWRTDQYFESDVNVHRIFAPRQVWKHTSPVRMATLIAKDRFELWRLLRSFRPDVLYCLHQSGIALPIVSVINSLPIPKVYRFGYEWPRLYYTSNRCPWYTFWKNERLSGVKPIIRKLLLRFPYGHQLSELKTLIVPFAIHNSRDLMKRILPYIKGVIRHEVIQNCVNVSRFAPNGAFHNNASEELKLLYVGRLVEHKGVHILLEALPLLKERFQALRRISLAIVGSSVSKEYFKRLRRIVKTTGMEAAVTFVGAVSHSEIQKFYHSHDILVFPSIKRGSNVTVEGCPSVLLEGMAAGIPIVARIGPGVEEVVQDGKTCIGTFYDSGQAVTEAVVRLWKDKNLQTLLIRNGIQKVNNEHNIERVLTRTEELLKEAITHKKRTHVSSDG